MTALKLVPGKESRDGGSWSADDFDVVLVDSGETVGRIYARTSAGMGAPHWWWGLAFFTPWMRASRSLGLPKARKRRSGLLRSGGVAWPLPRLRRLETGMASFTGASPQDTTSGYSFVSQPRVKNTASGQAPASALAQPARKISVLAPGAHVSAP